jgi:hypothetical protein
LEDKKMKKFVSAMLIVTMMMMAVPPATAGVVDRSPLTEGEMQSVAAQEVVDASQVAAITAGEGGDDALAIIGGVFLVLVLLAVAASSSA